MPSAPTFFSRNVKMSWDPGISGRIVSRRRFRVVFLKHGVSQMHTEEAGGHIGGEGGTEWKVTDSCDPIA